MFYLGYYFDDRPALRRGEVLDTTPSHLNLLALRFIFCRAVLTLFCLREESDQYLPVCIPELPDSLSPVSEYVQPAIRRLANHLNVANSFHLY
ncbi:unnamed protein product [Cuscuta campestris]|uniref:Uncharacterized protein n=1 Tax=Cuscuta campestris TaxID=132261 RepID=A0A484MLQ3_9ASTE|nr:unnamed protein product [Cuscuta campestris]VFQ89755.1 unnamed protein product [Cuscuta campestris]